MDVSLSEDGNFLVVKLAVSPRPSKSGKTTVIATTSGNQTFSDVIYDGKPVTIGVNAYIPKV
jgi:hypothetical protein